jgi:hypothetical protein
MVIQGVASCFDQLVVQLTELQHQEAAWNRSVLLQCDMGLQLP